MIGGTQLIIPNGNKNLLLANTDLSSDCHEISLMWTGLKLTRKYLLFVLPKLGLQAFHVLFQDIRIVG